MGGSWLELSHRKQYGDQSTKQCNGSNRPACLDQHSVVKGVKAFVDSVHPFVHHVKPSNHHIELSVYRFKSSVYRFKSLIYRFKSLVYRVEANSDLTIQHV